MPEYERNRALAYDAVAVSGALRCLKPAACPFLFVSGADDAALAAAGIPFVSGRHFQAPGWARIPFGGDLDAAIGLAHSLRTLA